MRKIKFILLSAGILLGVFWTLIGIGPRAAGDFPFGYRDYVKDGFSLPQTWSARGNGLGEPHISVLWGWPLDFLYGLGAKAGIDFSILFRLLAIVPIFALGLWGIRRLLKYYGVSSTGIFIGSLFYLINTYLILLIDGGQLSIALAYSWFPTAFLSVISSAEKGLKDKILAGFAVSILALFDIRFVYILAFSLIIQFVYQAIFASGQRRFLLFSGWLFTAIIIALVLIGLNLYWIFPVVLSKISIIPASYQNVSQTSFLNFTSLGHSITLLQPHWYLNVFGKVTPLLPEFFLIPILVFLAPVLRKKDKTVAFWLLIAVVSVFLAKGVNPPFAQIYQWLFTKAPGFSLFRDSTKFFFLVALSYSVLLAVTTDEIAKRLGKKAIIFLLVVAGYLVFLVRPVWLGKMTGMLANPPFQKEYRELASSLQSDRDFGRVLWLPTKAPLGFSSPTHLSLDAARLQSKRPFASAVAGTYETFNFLRAPYIGNLLDIAGVKYVVYPYPDTRRETLKQDNIDYYYWFFNKLASFRWAAKSSTNSAIALVETKKYEDRFFLAPNIYWVVGSDGIYADIPSGTLAKNALVFAEESPGISSRLEDFPSAKIIFYGKGDIDLAASFLDRSQFIFPAQDLDFSPKPENSGWPASNALPARSRYSVSGERSNAGWWKREAADLISWRGFLQGKYGIDNQDFDYGGGWAVAEGNQQLTINQQFASGKVLLARVMQSNRGGKIDFYQGDKLIGTIDTLLKNPKKVLVGDKEYDQASFGWQEVGGLTSDEPLTIKTSGDINVVNAVATLDIQDWNRANRQASVLVNQNRVFEWEKLTPTLKKQLFEPVKNGSVSYKRLDSTHYSVKVEGLKEPAVLAFSETYDPLWQINGKGPIELYSLINGFSVEKDGTYDVYFTPQKYVIPGLVISGLTAALLMAFAVWRRK